MKKYLVDLTADERAALQAVVRQGKNATALAAGELVARPLRPMGAVWR